MKRFLIILLIIIGSITVRAQEQSVPIDSTAIFNAALAAKNAGKHELAAKYFKKSTEIGFGGSDAYYLLKNEYIALEDSAMALQTLQDGYKLYPDTLLLVTEIVNFHLSNGEYKKGLKFLEGAQERDSENDIIYFLKGHIYEMMDDKEIANQQYKRSREIDPEFYDYQRQFQMKFPQYDFRK